MEQESLTQGDFKYVEGDIDRRDAKTKEDSPPHPGFKTLCGLKGGKLSGG
jgi:hypothetical protein